jgi:hypothetical protein
MSLTIQELVEKSLSRAVRWHDGDIHQWSVLEWAGAMAGEAGEACNAAKKLKRLESGIASRNDVGRHYQAQHEAKSQVALECADTILYALLVMASTDIDVHEVVEVIRQVFNKKSEEYNFPERV